MTDDQQLDASVTADAELPPLDDRSLALLREVGRQWAGQVPGFARTRISLPVDPELSYQLEDGTRRGRFVEIHTAPAGGEGELEATPMAGVPDSALGRIAYRARGVLVGSPLRSSAVAAERMGTLLALPVLSPDAFSSVAYGPEAMLAILVLAGSAELKLSLPIAAVLVVLMISVGLGYRQVIRAYPSGGGSYIVASDSLGSGWGLIAGAGLIVDYILTVAVSVAAGVAAVTSALPALSSAVVPIGLAVIVLLVFGNLRGVRAASAAFAVPTYMFISAIALIVAVGLARSGVHGFHPVAPAARKPLEAVSALLILRAFASGATAMTGIEVISNAVPVFRPPEPENARRSLSIMIVLLVAMFVGVTLVAHLDGASPGGETLLSQIARRSVGGGVPYGYVQVATTLVLLIAANSAVNGFRRLLYLHGPRRLRPARPAAPRGSPGLLGGHRRARRSGRSVIRGVRRANRTADSAVRRRGVRRVHARAGSDGRPLAPSPRARVATRAPHQPARGRALRRGRPHRRPHEVHRRRLGRRGPDPLDRRPLPADPPTLRARAGRADSTAQTGDPGQRGGAAGAGGAPRSLARAPGRAR